MPKLIKKSLCNALTDVEVLNSFMEEAIIYWKQFNPTISLKVGDPDSLGVFSLWEVHQIIRGGPTVKQADGTIAGGEEHRAICTVRLHEWRVLLWPTDGKGWYPLNTKTLAFIKRWVVKQIVRDEELALKRHDGGVLKRGKY